MKTNPSASIFYGVFFATVGVLAAFISLLLTPPTLSKQEPSKRNQIAQHIVTGNQTSTESYKAKLQSFLQKTDTSFSEEEVNALLTSQFSIPAPTGSGISISPLNINLSEKESQIHLRIQLPSDTPAWIPIKQIIWNARGHFTKHTSQWEFVSKSQYLNSARLPSFINFINQANNQNENEISKNWKNISNIETTNNQIRFTF